MQVKCAEGRCSRRGHRAAGHDEGPVAGDGAFCCSPGWARTSDPSINSRMLCQLSYGGPALLPAHENSSYQMFMVASCSAEAVET